MRILNKIFKKKNPVNNSCTVRTPQFKDSVVREWMVQEGTINLETFEFTPNDLKKGHKIQFRSLDNFEKYRI